MVTLKLDIKTHGVAVVGEPYTVDLFYYSSVHQFVSGILNLTGERVEVPSNSCPCCCYARRFVLNPHSYHNLITPCGSSSPYQHERLTMVFNKPGEYEFLVLYDWRPPPPGSCPQARHSPAGAMICCRVKKKFKVNVVPKAEFTGIEFTDKAEPNKWYKGVAHIGTKPVNYYHYIYFGIQNVSNEPIFVKADFNRYRPVELKKGDTLVGKSPTRQPGWQTTFYVMFKNEGKYDIKFLAGISE